MVALLVFCSLHTVRSEDVASLASSVDEDLALRETVAGQISQLEEEALYSADDDDLSKRAATMKRAADLAEETFGEHHWLTTLSRSLADGLKSVAGLPANQQELFADAMAAQSKGRRLASDGKHEVALKELKKAHEKRSAAIGADHVLTVYLLSDIWIDEYQLGAMEVAKSHATATLPVAAARWGKHHPAYAYSLRNLAMAEIELHEFDAAVKHLNQAISILEPVVAEGLSDFYTQAYAVAHLGLARVNNEQGEFAAAEAPARRAVELLAPYPQMVYLDTLASLLELARSESGQGKTRQADVTFASMRRVRLAELPPGLAESFKAAYDDHFRRSRQAESRHADRQADSPVRK